MPEVRNWPVLCVRPVGVRMYDRLNSAPNEDWHDAPEWWWRHARSDDIQTTTLLCRQNSGVCLVRECYCCWWWTGSSRRGCIALVEVVRLYGGVVWRVWGGEIYVLKRIRMMMMMVTVTVCLVVSSDKGGLL